MPAADFISHFRCDMKSGGRDATPVISAGVTIRWRKPIRVSNANRLAAVLASQSVEFQVSRFQIQYDRSRLDVGGRLVIDPAVSALPSSRNLLVFWFQHFKCDSIETSDLELCAHFSSTHPSGGCAGNPRVDQGRQGGTWVATPDFLPGRGGFLTFVGRRENRLCFTLFGGLLYTTLHLQRGRVSARPGSRNHHISLFFNGLRDLPSSLDPRFLLTEHAKKV